MFHWETFERLEIKDKIVFYNLNFLSSISLEVDELFHFVEYYLSFHPDVKYVVLDLWNDDGCIIFGSQIDPKNEPELFVNVLYLVENVCKESKTTSLPILEEKGGGGGGVILIPKQEMMCFKNMRDSIYPHNRTKVCYWSSFEDLARHAPLGPCVDVLAHRPDLKKDIDEAFRMFQQQTINNPKEFSTDSESE